MSKRVASASNGQLLAWLGLSVLAGALSGASAALIVTPRTVQVTPSPFAATSTLPLPNATSTSPQDVVEVGPSLIRLVPRSALSLVPPSVLTRRASPVASVYRRARGTTPEERTLGEDRLLGQAVSLTSDGWFVTTVAVIGTHASSDLTLWMNGKSYAVERGLIDRLNDTAYLKVLAAELPSPAFADVTDLVPGAELWIERRAVSFMPSLVTVLSDQLPAVEPASSEVALRRIRLNGLTDAGESGAPVWDVRGSLLGIIESKEGEPLLFIPSVSLAASFSLLINSDQIRHARLGVRGVDLTAWKIDGSRGDLPGRGVLLKDDRKTGRLAIAKDSPAAKAGLKAGDVILSVERDNIDGTADLGEILSEYRADAPVTLRILRAGIEMDVPVTLGSLVTSEVLK